MERTRRRLSAILSADVAGYSRLMAGDDVATVGTLTQYRDIMSDNIKMFHGRVVDSPGDNLLAEFVSAVDAVECAVNLQTRLLLPYKDPNQLDNMIAALKQAGFN
ncbi:MAG: hypothetical protein ABFS43_03760 [Thermodesulfobacteriota bacterium]